jgi:hypothetical protein
VVSRDGRGGRRCSSPGSPGTCFNIDYSPLVVMSRDQIAARCGYTAQSHIKALEDGFVDRHRAGEWFMQDNTPVCPASASRACLEIRGVAIANWPPCSPPHQHIDLNFGIE